MTSTEMLTNVLLKASHFTKPLDLVLPDYGMPEQPTLQPTILGFENQNFDVVFIAIAPMPHQRC